MAEGSGIYLMVQDEVHGPFARADIVEGLSSGEIPPDTLAAHANDEEWRPISSLIQIAPIHQKQARAFTQTVKIRPQDLSK